MARYVAVHGGAGAHSRSSDRDVKLAMKRACSSALQASATASAIDLVQEAICVLEDDECLNAGYGSNLTLDGTVECDAAIMDGLNGHFGSVGAVPGVRNPVKLARAVLDHSRIPGVLGRIPPLTLVASGARDFGAARNVPMVPPATLASPRPHAEWVRWKERYDDALHTDDHAHVDGLNSLQDTVGAVSWDATGGMAAGVSSGGLLLKYPGRVGEAAVFGAGCWAQQDGQERGMACSVSGAGEHIVRCGLARAIGDSLRHAPSHESHAPEPPPHSNVQDDDSDIDSKVDDEDAEPDTHAILERILVEQFWHPTRACGEPAPNAGVLLLTKEPDQKARLWCAFTSESMAVAYASSDNPTPKAMILRRPPVEVGRPSVFITALPI
ncbi:hypothetical protein PLICRDRAFT_37586 [Plicaturopsis crispa FD-325 SS-3]|nr:hypothetical protein PLICRDRAFT_37586 [Plicaturopsis crispa FD-325 SS-3]